VKGSKALCLCEKLFWGNSERRANLHDSGQMDIKGNKINYYKNEKKKTFLFLNDVVLK